MPAVTADPLTLTRVGLDIATKPELRDRPVKRITVAPSGHEGEGFPVRRTFYGATRAEVDPFIMMDQMGEVDYAPYEPRGTDWHPHRGFETVTYVMDGTFLHQDTHGGGGVITDGGTQWMTAGGGILHIETPPEEYASLATQCERLRALVPPGDSLLVIADPGARIIPFSPPELKKKFFKLPKPPPRILDSPPPLPPPLPPQFCAETRHVSQNCAELRGKGPRHPRR